MLRWLAAKGRMSKLRRKGGVKSMTTAVDPQIAAARAPLRRTGGEPFHDRGAPLGMDVLGYWRWAYSDILSNAARGKLAEYIVACALGADGGVRIDWDAYDLRTPEGWKVEVKSAAYWQSWPQKGPSAIVFRIPRSWGWTAEDNSFFDEPTRAADVYVFAVLAHMDKATIDPLDIAQWDFYVLPTAVLEAKCAVQKTISLGSLLWLEPIQTKYAGLRAAVAQAAGAQAA